jgi:hypothetical protein
MSEEYTKAVETLAEDFVQFFEAAKGGKSGRGSKTKALQARKLSMTITNNLKEFRALSVANDKAK